MKQVARLTLCLTMISFFLGCMEMKTNTQPFLVDSGAVSQLIINQSVALKNSAPQEGEIIIGKWCGWKVYGDLYKYTESTIGTIEQIFDEQNIQVNDSANKVLELEIYNAESIQGAWVFSASVSLRVKTGNGLMKEFTGLRKHPNGYQTTCYMERAMADCVTNMLNDQKIQDYLKQ